MYRCHHFLRASYGGGAHVSKTRLLGAHPHLCLAETGLNQAICCILQGRGMTVAILLLALSAQMLCASAAKHRCTHFVHQSVWQCMVAARHLHAPAFRGYRSLHNRLAWRHLARHSYLQQVPRPVHGLGCDERTMLIPLLAL